MTSNFLLEILSEEIPALMQKAAAENFAKIAFEVLSKNNIALELWQVKTFVTPRRLSLVIENLKPVQTIPAVKKFGPKVGADKRAIEGFLKSVGLKNESELQQAENNGALCYLHVVAQSEIKIIDIIKPSLAQILQRMTNSWPKLMRWDVGNLQPKWIRPIRNILCLYGDQIIDLEFAGLASNNITFGHQFYNSNQKLIVDNAKNYEKILLDNFVILDQAARKKKIIEQIQKIKLELGCNLIDDEEKSALFDEVTGLCEWPTALLGNIENTFLDLPDEVLILTLKLNQRYFCLKSQQDVLLPQFIFVSNAIINQNNQQKIIADNEKLVKARLSDAHFFVEEDLKHPLISRLNDLKKVVFHKKLGSVYDKTRRLSNLSKFLSIFVPHSNIAIADHVADLCKNDLVTKAVAELPELQGKIGSFYALNQKENPKVVAAIFEHYLPLGPSSQMPQTPLGIVFSIADKMDSIVGFFLADEKPTSSKDPYALRRAALGIIRIGFEHNIAFPIRILIEKSLSAYPAKLLKKALQEKRDISYTKQKLIEEIVRFFVERLKSYLKENEMLRADIVNVVIEEYLANLEIHKLCDTLYLAKKVKFLSKFVTDAENRNVIELYKRSANILAIEEKKDGCRYQGTPALLSLKNKYEKTLYRRVKQIKPEFNKLIIKGDFEAAFKLFHVIEMPLAHFFDHIVVNDPDQDVRENRLLLLSKIRSLFDLVADLSKVEI